ncbi:MAG: PDZ domain-containing protein [Candidatus Alcyoniella australis]|nr:PDZ domain-containing protein [Candidatus Alcyoniella australis]
MIRGLDYVNKLVFALIITLLALTAGCEPAPPPVVQPLMPPAPGLDDLEARIIDVAGFVAPSVVLVRTRHIQQVAIEQPGSVALQTGSASALRLGSGMAIDPQGLILTTAHQVEGNLATFVELPDGRELPAELVGIDELCDLALLKVDAGEELPVPDLAGSVTPQPGRWVVGVGGILSGGRSMAHGVVLASGRLPEGYDGYETFIQTNIAVIDELAGGPLLTLDGRVIGLLTRLGTRQGVGYAVPLDTCRWVAAQLASGGKVRRSFLGLSGSSLTPGQARARGKQRGGAVMVTEARPGTPAAKAGIIPGDMLTAVNSEPIDDFHSLQRLISRIPPYSEVQIELVRHGQPNELNARLLPAPDDYRLYESQWPQGTEALIGISVVAMPEGLDQSGGVMVVKIDPATVQQAVDLQVGDVIEKADGFPINRPEQLATLLWSRAPGTSVLFESVRDGERRMVAVEVK